VKDVLGDDCFRGRIANNMKLRPDRRLANVLRVRSLISTQRDCGSYL
jgi:hypothetical protein